MNQRAEKIECKHIFGIEVGVVNESTVDAELQNQQDSGFTLNSVSVLSER